MENMKVHARKKLKSAELMDVLNVEKMLHNACLGDFSVPSRRLGEFQES